MTLTWERENLEASCIGRPSRKFKFWGNDNFILAAFGVCKIMRYLENFHYIQGYLQGKLCGEVSILFR